MKSILQTSDFIDVRIASLDSFVSVTEVIIVRVLGFRYADLGFSKKSVGVYQKPWLYSKRGPHEK